MKTFKKVLLIFLISLMLFTVKSFAGYEVADPNSLDDPIHTIRRQEVQSGTLESINTYIGKFETSDSVIGIDVSSWQGEIDWAQVANSGVKFAIIRVGYRTTVSGNLFEDKYARRNIEGAINNGIYVGVYCYSTALNEAEALEEANMVLDIIRGYDIKYFVAYDFENFEVDGYRTDNLDRAQMNRNARVFLDRVKESGYTPCLYGSSYPLRDYWKMKEFSDCSTWVAHYNTNKPSYTGKYDMWQLSSTGKVNGITGAVDVDVDYTYFFKYNNIDITPYMFDAKFYADSNADIKAVLGYNEAALKDHFQRFGKYEGRYSTPLFNARYYLESNADIRAVYGNDYAGAFDHFVAYGAKEGRQGSKYIDSVYYLNTNADLKRAFYCSKTRALAHFYEFGAREGRQGSKEFDAVSYKKTLSAYYQKHLGNDYLKYMSLDNGGMPYSDSNIDITYYMFNPKFYADNNEDIRAIYGYDEAGLRAHYEAFGKREGRQASVIFDPVYYLENNSDIKAVYGNNYAGATEHFIRFGAAEGRGGSQELQVMKYIENNGDIEAEFGPYYTKAIAHFATYGYAEGRKGN